MLHAYVLFLERLLLSAAPVAADLCEDLHISHLRVAGYAPGAGAQHERPSSALALQKPLSCEQVGQD